MWSAFCMEDAAADLVEWTVPLSAILFPVFVILFAGIYALLPWVLDALHVAPKLFCRVAHCKRCFALVVWKRYSLMHTRAGDSKGRDFEPNGNMNSNRFEKYMPATIALETHALQR